MRGGRQSCPSPADPVPAAFVHGVSGAVRSPRAMRDRKRAVRDTRPLTEKGERSAARVLKAATTVLARDGFGGASLGRIAEEADLDKRGILYYYGTREALLVRVVQNVGEQIAEHVGAVAEIATTPTALVDAFVDALWAGVTSMEELSRAYFALVGGGAGAPEVETALHQIKAAYVHAITHRLQAIDENSWHLPDPEGSAMYTLALLRGLLLEWIETGDSPRLRGNLARFKDAVAAEYRAV